MRYRTTCENGQGALVRLDADWPMGGCAWGNVPGHRRSIGRDKAGPRSLGRRLMMGIDSLRSALGDGLGCFAVALILGRARRHDCSASYKYLPTSPSR